MLPRKYRDQRTVDERAKSVAELFKRREEESQRQAKVDKKCFVCGVPGVNVVVVAGKIIMACEEHTEAVRNAIDKLTPNENKPFKGLVSEGISA